MQIYVIRHGEVESNRNKTVGGLDDEPLTEHGIEQAESVREKLSNITFDVILCSPVYRAKQTAQIVNEKNIPILYDDRIAEREPGDMIGKSRSTIDKTQWNRIDIDRIYGNTETLGSGLKRTKQFLEEIRERYQDKTVLIVTHNFICKCIWMLENHITDSKQIEQYLQKNDEVKQYGDKIEE